jgi:hypothetical protein
MRSNVVSDDDVAGGSVLTPVERGEIVMGMCYCGMTRDTECHCGTTRDAGLYCVSLRWG